MSSDYASVLNNHPMVQQLINETLPLYWTDAELLYDTPYKIANSKDDLLVHKLSEMIAKAEHDFFLVSPYFVPTEEGAKVRAKAAQNGKILLL